MEKKAARLAALRREAERQQKRLEFMTRRQLPELGTGAYTVRETIREEHPDGPIRGEIGLRDHSGQSCRIVDRPPRPERRANEDVAELSRSDTAVGRIGEHDSLCRVPSRCSSRN